MLSGAVAVVSSANRSLLSCAEVTHSTSCFDLHFDVYFHTKQQQWCKTTVSAQCWDWLGSLKVLEFWEVVTHPQMMRMSRAVSVAGWCWQRHPSVPVQNGEARQEQLLSWLRLQWEVSSPGECIPGSGAASPFCLSHRRPAREQHWDSCISGVRDSMNTLWDFLCVAGLEGEAAAARAVLCREHKEVCSIMGRGSQTCSAGDKCALPSAAFVSWQEWHHPGGKLVTAILCLLASFSRLLNLPSLILPSLFSLFHHNKWTSYSLQRHFGPSLEDLKFVHIPIPQPAGCVWKPKTS